MDIVEPFDFTAVFRIIHPLAKGMVKAGTSPNLTLYKLADDYMEGKLGPVVTQEIGNALWTLAHNAVKVLINQPEFNEAQQLALKTVADFRDYMKLQGKTLNV